MENLRDIPKTYEEHLALGEHLDQHDGRRLQNCIEEIDRALFVLEGNYSGLRGIIAKFGQRETFVYFDVRNRDDLERYLLEITRHIHNFVSASMTLVDHSRRVMREYYESDDFLAEYEDRIGREVGANGLTQFIQGLRNFTLHRSIPPIAAVLDLNAISHKLVLDRDALLLWDGWKAVAKQYLADAIGDVDLATVVDGYMEVIRSLHDWRYKRQCEIHRNIFEDYNRLSELYRQSKWSPNF